MAVGLIRRWQFRPRATGSVVLTTVALLCGTCFGGTEAKLDGQDPLALIVPSMERAQSQVQLPAQIIREYHMSSSAKISTDSQVVAQMEFAPSPRYVIQRREGSLRAEFVVKSVLQHELDISASNQRLRAAAITHQNYDFQFAGSDTVEGHSCYVLQLLPKRGQPE